MTDYEIREFRPDDRDGFLDLYETVFDADRDTAWFEWKYGADNPHFDGTPIYVADHDGEVVGARPFFALRMAAGETAHLALQPSDTMVHPDHRRQGLFTRMTTTAVEQYAGSEARFCFNFPNPNSRPGYMKLDWEIAAEPSTHYRLHDPAALADGLPSLAADALEAAASAYYRFRTPEAPTEARLSVRQPRDDPVETLADLYRRSTAGSDDPIHAVRDETFYEWRLAAPTRTYETYVAERDGEAVAALVVGRESRAGAPTVRVLDALAVGDAGARRAAYTALLSAMLADHRDTALVAVRGGLPEPVLRRFGFHSDASPPLSAVASTSMMVTRPIGDAGWTVGGRDLREPDSWRLTFAELDSA